MKRIRLVLVAAFVTLGLGAFAVPAGANDAPTSTGGLPAGTCGSERPGCACGGVYVLKFTFGLAYC